MSNQRGTTIVELLIYIGIVGVILTTIASFLLNILLTRVKAQTISEMVTQARVIQDYLHDAARHAESLDIGASTFNTDPGVLVFHMADITREPTVFSLSTDDGVFQVNVAGSGNVPLTTQAVSLSNLQFINLTSAEDLGMIHVQF